MACLEVEKSLSFLSDVLEQICALNVFESALKKRLESGVIEIISVDSKSIKTLNKMYLHKDKTTDVLSFPLDTSLQSQEYGALLGSIVINIELANNNAKRFKHHFNDEIILLFVHGLLHILGFNHECDNGEQRALEKQILALLGIKYGLMERTDEA